MGHLMSRSILFAFILILMSGCGALSPSGTEDAARNHFDREMKKWMAGQGSETKRASLEFSPLKPPISYEISSIVPGSPNPFAKAPDSPNPDNEETFPAFVVNAVLNWGSEAGTPMQTVNGFNLTWNTNEAKWYVTKEL
jgi:hypothetical protein